MFQRRPDVTGDQDGQDNGSAVMDRVGEKSQRFVLADQYGQIEEAEKTHRMSPRHSVHVTRNRLDENQHVQDPMQAVGGGALQLRDAVGQRRGLVGETPAESNDGQRENQNS